MRWDWFWASLAAASLLLVAAPSYARVPTRLVYARTQAASDCPDESALAAAVAARLGYEPFSPWGDQTILATITKKGGVLLGHAELIDHDGIAQGSREVRVSRPECAELILALALAISITLDPLHVDSPAAAPDVSAAEASPSTEEPPSVSEPDLAPAPAAPRHDRAPTVARKAQPEPVTWHVAAAALGTLAAAPQLAMGGRLALTARRGRWGLGIEAWSTFASTEAAARGGEVSVRLVSAALTPCVRLVGDLSVCALGSLGSTRAQGHGVEGARIESVLHAAAGGRALFAVPLGSTFRLLANADLAATLNRPRFQLDGIEVWQPSPVLAIVGIGAEARFF